MGLALPMMLAASPGAVVSLGDASDSVTAVYDGVFQPEITAGYALQNDGDVSTANAGDIGDWIAPKSAAGADYEARATVLTGALTTGTTGSWLALSTTREWSVTQSGGAGTTECVLLIEIRAAGGGSPLASAQVTLVANLT